MRYTYYTAGVLLLVLLTLVLLRTSQPRRRNPGGLPFPPGPKGYPIIGSLLSLPLERPWLVYNVWKKVYGDLIYFEVLGQPFLIIGNSSKWNDLFDKRSAIYSDRPAMPMVVDLMGWGFSLAFSSYGTWWKKQRRVFHEHFSPTAVQRYRHIQIEEAHNLLRYLLGTPDDFILHIRHVFMAIILRISYGIQVDNTENPYAKNVEAALACVVEAGMPGAFLVDFIPALKYIPEWFPGASFQKKARKWRELNEDVVNLPFNFVKNQLRNGIAIPSVASSLIDRLPEHSDPKYEENEVLAKRISAVSYVAAADTTNSAVQGFFLSMVLYPNVMKKAQEELDSVVGPNRLPDFSDRASLPYINAMVKESMRWHTVASLGIPHMSSRDDEYAGYFIPKGTIVIGNAWSVLHDPTVFKDPSEYIPERYLKDGQINPAVLDTGDAAFGAGRRKCPGKYLSDESLYIIIASTLALFNIGAPLDDDGQPVKPPASFSSGLISYPTPFKCHVTSRSPDRARLL